MVYVYLALSSVCSLLIAHLLKLTEVKNLRTLNTLTVNYAVASAVALLAGIIGEGNAFGTAPSFLLLAFCIVAGALFIGNFVAYGKSVHLNGVGITVAAMRLSLLIPVLVSIFFYREFLDGWKIAGVALVFCSLLLLVPRKRSVKIGNLDAYWLLLIIFLVTGLADASLKIYNEEFSQTINEPTFMGWVLAGAFVIGLVLSRFRGGPMVTKEELKMGAMIGIPNLYSSIFLIYALEGISGAIAFPIVNVLNVIGGSLLGVLIWNDRVTIKQWSGIAVALIAILLLV